jgi:hypothetical protein
VKDNFILEKNVLSEIKDTVLFYPSSGNDLITPVKIFSPFVTEFWFVDKGYFVPGHPNTRSYGLDVPADKQAPLLGSNKDYKLVDTQLSGAANRDKEPSVLTERYLHHSSGKHITIHRRRGYGFRVFREIKKLGVFFYRGDSLGEGGSGDLWLESDHIDEICEKLNPAGLIVTDGSNQGRKNVYPYQELTKYYFRSEDTIVSPEELIESMEQFHDFHSRVFKCIGYAGHRYGPTMIWQVKKGRIPDYE